MLTGWRSSSRKQSRSCAYPLFVWGRRLDNRLIAARGHRRTPLPGANIISAGGLYRDRRTFITLALPETLTVAGVDPVQPYLVLTNSHDGSTALTTTVTVRSTGFRVSSRHATLPHR